MRKLWQGAIGLALALPAATRSAAAADPVSFRRDVVPVLTRLGCNSGTCHGTPSGKNGFCLSLRGFDAGADHGRLTREVIGRRVDTDAPDQSLLLRKATGSVPHGGGLRLETDSSYYGMLHEWIRQGAHDDGDGAGVLADLAASPRRAELTGPAPSVRITVEARFQDGTVRDVTALSRFGVSDESVASVTPDGRVERRRSGEAAVIAEYLGRIAVADLACPQEDAALVWDEPPVVNYVDELVFAKLRALRIPPAPLATAPEILRRLYLDLVGIPPSAAEARKFLEDRSPRKRERLIDELLDRPEFAERWGLHWADRLGVNQRFVGQIGAYKFHEWITHAMAVNLPEDELARKILTATGGNYSNAPVGFFRRLREPEAAAENVSQLFLGLRLECAHCHNHPGDRWTQADYYGIAAFFARVRFKDGPYFNHLYDKEETVFESREGELHHPRTGSAMPPRFLDGTTPAPSSGAGRREALAAWITSPSNPWFARQSANRIWFHLFGAGIVEPVDDVRATNPPSNEPLLAALAQDLVAHGFDRKHLIRTILRSSTYQLSSRSTASNAWDERYFSHARPRLLGAEQLLDSVCAVTGIPERFEGLPLGFRAAQVPDGEYSHRFLAAFGRPARAMTCECERDSDSNLLQALQLAGRVVDSKVRADDGLPARLAASGAPTARILEDLYLAALGRYPSAEEAAELGSRLDASPERRAALEDILWALLNHREFLFLH